MRSDIIRVYKSVHTWTGILSGMALFIAFYAGALTIFKEPLTRWASPPAVLQAASLADAPTLIARTLAARPEVARDFRLHVQQDEHQPARLSWEVRDQNGDDHDESGARHYRASLSADGSAQIEEIHPASLATWIDTLHRVAGLPVDNDPNRWIMGIIASLYALALISGVIVLLPSLVKDFFALRVGKNLKRMWLDAHNVVGIVSLPFHLVMALTAAVFAFHDGIYAVQSPLLYGGKSPEAAQAGPRAGAGPGATVRDPARMLTPVELLARVRTLSPGFEPTLLQYQKVDTPRALARVWGHDPAALSPRARGGFVAIDPYSGQVKTTDYLPGQQGNAFTTVSSFFALHFATYGGAPVQWAYFLLGLAGAWLFYSGNLLWIETRRRKLGRDGGPPPEQRRDVRLMAAATVGVCLGCVCGVSLTIVASKWLHGQVADLAAWHRGLYYLMFFAALAWAFVRGGARAGVGLLWLASALTLAIPLTSLLAWLLPALGLWTHTSMATLGVDVTALFGALALAAMARAAHRRVHGGAQDSVWSARLTSTPSAPTVTADAPHG